ncbi:unnamed protein product [Amoebophrya sp. A25]|nr:unnamed protein product [Amoebophrya sp. A25]|eukprot:GSA25T00011092001.1
MRFNRKRSRENEVEAFAERRSNIGYRPDGRDTSRQPLELEIQKWRQTFLQLDNGSFAIAVNVASLIFYESRRRM